MGASNKTIYRDTMSSSGTKISNVFGGTEDQAAGAQGKRVGGNGNASDIFHLSEEHQQATPTKAGKKHYDGKRDNDIFGIRERVTGETTNAAETQLQAST